ncbi:MAG: hypothetical protein KC912_18795 [Proteobacteria bacterium]|nr:hypothetical protein [Pseudomonadota bacterium]
MSGSAAERVSALTEEVAATLGRRVDRVVGELSDGADFESIEKPASEVLATAAAMKRIAEDLVGAEREATALHAAMLQLEARGEDDSVVQAVEARVNVAVARRDALISNLERLAASIKSGRVRSR